MAGFAALRTLGINLAINHASFRRDVDKVDKRMKRMARNTHRVARTMQSNFAGLGATFAGIATGRFIKTQADAMVNLRNKLGAVYDEQVQVADAMIDIKRIARESRADLDAVGTLYQRMAVSTKALGVSQKQVATITQVVSDSFILSGTTSQEAANSARQFAQGLASGALKGDEFRSVSENNVVLTMMLAEGLNMTVGQLKEFASQGGLTAQTILPILNANLDKTREAVDKMQLTMGQATLLIKNRFTVMIDSLNQRFGIVNKIANAMKGLAKNIGIVTAVISALLVPALTIAVARGFMSFLGYIAGGVVGLGTFALNIALVTKRLVLMGVAMLANPIGLFIALVVGAVAIMYEWVGGVDGMKAGFKKLGEMWTNVIKLITEAIVKFGEFIKPPGWDTFVSLVEKIGAKLGVWLGPAWNSVEEFVSKTTESMKGVFKGLGEFGKATAKAIGEGFVAITPPSLKGEPDAQGRKGSVLINDISDKMKEITRSLLDLRPDLSFYDAILDKFTGFTDGMIQKAMDTTPWLRDFWAILNGTYDPDNTPEMRYARELAALDAFTVSLGERAQTIGGIMRQVGTEMNSIGSTAAKGMTAALKTTGDVLEGLAGEWAAFAAVKKAIIIKDMIVTQAAVIMDAWKSAPFPYNIPAVAMATAQTALLLKQAGAGGGSLKGGGSDISTLIPKRAPAPPKTDQKNYETTQNIGFYGVKGQAHKGIDSIPTTGTYLLEAGERVVDKRLNKDLSTFLTQIDNSSSKIENTASSSRSDSRTRGDTNKVVNLFSEMNQRNEQRTVMGQFHDGINSVPDTGTYLLERGERVVDSRLNTDLSGFLKAPQQAAAGESKEVHLHVNGVSDPDVVIEALSTKRGELESMVRQIAADNARPYRG